MKVKILKAFAGYIAGEVVKVSCSRTGIPLSKEWRERLKSRINGDYFTVESNEQKASKKRVKTNDDQKA